MIWKGGKEIMHCRVTTKNACFGVETDEKGIILNTSYTAPIARRYAGKHINTLKRWNAKSELMKEEK